MRGSEMECAKTDERETIRDVTLAERTCSRCRQPAALVQLTSASELR